ncbi:site-specific integrase [Oceanidesulfovibrio indonesiensis]|uniref:Site-specific integrase n=1 Tax=Oceanidesulfovibrio indonesiensis TaxID=54767 RepID=A0A7M3MAV7_9BACT|nr:tyrosine-type recombinase/integrase [Oceanidesulfovibrio indonesiensis]TVM14539.1 site-specific integrase [Oceanidesulfovibrio indonesiensis]
MKVDPIISLKDVKSIKKLLVESPRDRLLFVMGINTGLRVQDLLALKVSDLMYRKVGDRVTIRERKTNKENVFIVNKEIKQALDAHLQTADHKEEHYLFKSRKGFNAPLSTYAVTKMVKRWCAAVNLKGNYGAHTLRKTWTYHQRKTFGVSWEVLAKRLNHSSPAVTRAYLGIQEEEIETVLLENWL